MKSYRPNAHLTRIALSFLLVGLTGCQAKQSQLQLPEESTAAVSTTPLSKGHELFLTHCVSCHQGAGNPPGPNAVILDSETLKSQTEFTALIRHPRSGMMTPFDPETLPDGDAKELYSYLLSAKNPTRQSTP